MGRRWQRLFALLSVGVSIAAVIVSCGRRATPPLTATSPPTAVATATRAPQPLWTPPVEPSPLRPTGQAPVVVTMTRVPSPGSTVSATPSPTPVATPTPMPITLTGGENDQSNWQEWRQLSWGIAFRYPKQWLVSVLPPSQPGEPDVIEIAGGGRALRLMRQAPGRGLDGSARLEPVAVGPVTGQKLAWRGPHGELFDVIIVPDARRDAIGLIQYRLLGGQEDPIYMALFDAVLATLRFDVGQTPVGPSQPVFASYRPRQVTLPTRHRGYALPLDLSLVANLGEVSLTPAQKEALTANGFFAVPGEEREFYRLYQSLYYEGKPVFVTTDSLLHTYHLLFDRVLRAAEREHLAPNLLSLSRQLLATAEATQQSARGTPLEAAATRALAYFAVAVRLQDPNASVPAVVQDVVARELALIEAHQGWAVSPLLDRPDLGQGDRYREDYSQYVPRGHYTLSEDLRRYFQAMMWYGRINLRIKDREETRTALLITQILLRSQVGGAPALSAWEAIYEPTTFFVGRTDDLNVYDLRNLAISLYGGLGDNPRLFADDEQLTAFMKAAQALPGPKVNSMWVWLGEEPATATRGFRFMGQRFVIDAYVFSELLWDGVGTVEKPRLLPRGLDIPAALGSEEAYRLLEELGETAYARYPEKMAQVRKEVAALPGATWTETLYGAWLDALRPLLGEKDARYPEFMRSRAWARKDLQTMLGSWTELKHDTVLYAKQAAAAGMGGPPEESAGYVEPNPEVYARLAALSEMTLNGLDSRGLLGKNERAALERLQRLAERLQAIAERELAGQALSADDQTFIRRYGDEIYALARQAAEGAGEGAGIAPEDQEAALVADVATGGANVLEEATGRIARLYVVVQNGDRLLLTQGGIYTYYEFPWPAEERLTDEKWRAMLQAKQVPPPPPWTRMFVLE